MPHEVQRLQTKHLRIVDLALEGLGAKEIASIVGMTPVGIGMLLRSPLVQAEISRRRGLSESVQDEARGLVPNEALKILQNAAVPAANVQVSLLEAEDDSIRQRASKEILERVFGPSKTQEGSSRPQIVINTETLQVLQTALQESRL